MSKLDTLVQDFLSQKKIAGIGVSDKRDMGCNAAYKKLKESGSQVYVVNPRMTIFDGAQCYPDLKSIPELPDAVFTLTSPKVTEQVAQQCVDLGIKQVWMHRMLGIKPVLAASMTSVSQQAVQSCHCFELEPAL